MRLITKTTLLFLLLALIVFSIGGIVTYQMVKKVVRQETDYSLRSNLRMLKESIEQGNPIEALQSRKVKITQVDSTKYELRKRIITDTLVMHRPVKGLEPFRKLVIVEPINNKCYRFELMDVFIESNDMYSGVLNIMSKLFIGLSIVLLIGSFLISNWLFRPFKYLLQSIGGFNLKDQDTIQFPITSTSEFNELHSFIDEMTSKARKDYLALKEFSENASHELQTPISIAKGKLELLQESPNITPEELKLLQEAQHSLTRLSRMGTALSLLTKIENEEFSKKEEIDLSETVEQNLATFTELAHLKNLKVSSQIQKGIKINLNAALADIMVANLFKNAIQHNEENGWIEVQLNDHELKVINPGKAPKVDTYKLFERFRKSNQSSKSLGLGLAIIKKITQVNNLQVDYAFQNGVHELSVQFDKLN